MPNADEVEGRMKEAAGDLTGDEDLQREGKIDQASGKVKEKIDDAAESAKDAVESDYRTRRPSTTCHPRNCRPDGPFRPASDQVLSFSSTS